MLGAAQRFSTDVQRHIDLGQFVAKQGDLESAVRHYEQAVEQSPGSKPLLFILGALYQKVGDYEKAEGTYRKVLALYPKDADAQLCLGNILLAQRRIEEAAKAFRSATEMAPGNAVAFRNLGFAELRAGAPYSAVKSLERSVALDGTNALARFDLGMTYAALGRQAASQKAFRSGLALEASIEGKLSYTDMLDIYAGPLVDDAKAAFKSNDFAAAERILTGALKEFPDYALAYCYLGHVYHHQKPARPAEAEAAYRKALDALASTVLPPVEHAILLDNLGMIRENLGDYAEAEDLFRRGVDLETPYPLVYFNYGCMCARKEAYETAAVAFSDAVRRDPRVLEYVKRHVVLDTFRATAMYTNLLTTFRTSK